MVCENSHHAVPTPSAVKPMLRDHVLCIAQYLWVRGVAGKRAVIENSH